MGIHETLQEALERANNERHNCYDRVQGYEAEILDLKVNLQRAQTQKAGVDMLHKTATSKHDELCEHVGKLSDESARNALRPDIEECAQEVNMIVRNLQRMGEAERECQRQILQAETRRASALTNLAVATERWEHIKKQIENLNR
jgi:chromosome segregation ATPase